MFPFVVPAAAPALLFRFVFFDFLCFGLGFVPLLLVLLTWFLLASRTFLWSLLPFSLRAIARIIWWTIATRTALWFLLFLFLYFLFHFWSYDCCHIVLSVERLLFVKILLRLVLHLLFSQFLQGLLILFLNVPAYLLHDLKQSVIHALVLLILAEIHSFNELDQREVDFLGRTGKDHQNEILHEWLSGVEIIISVCV